MTPLAPTIQPTVKPTIHSTNQPGPIHGKPSTSYQPVQYMENNQPVSMWYCHVSVDINVGSFNDFFSLGCAVWSSLSLYDLVFRLVYDVYCVKYHLTFDKIPWNPVLKEQKSEFERTNWMKSIFRESLTFWKW